MAGPDPRRSSRSRTIQPQSRPSSTTSSVSGRVDRAPKPFVKTGSPQKSASTASLASELADEAAAAADDTPPPPTRSRRAAQANVIKDDDQDLSSVVVSEIEMLNDGDDVQEDDEAVRCICGYEDYPGPPAPEDLKQAAKDGYDVESIFPTVVTDDLAGFFVQCDICKVWQHGACVGLVNDNTLPEEYYCEECRKDFHRIFPGTNGPRCSIYLALNRRRSRTGSFVKDRERSPKLRDTSKDGKDGKDGNRDATKEATKEPKSTRSAPLSQTSKRRSTMNSRDAAYDEEQLRIAIEASKGEADPAEVGSRRPKRSRSDSEEKSDSIKRQRTSSRSVSPVAEKSTAADDSDDAMATRNGSSKKASRTAAAARTQQQREKAEKEEKERQRAEAANKRNGRAERRRADDSDPSDEVPLAARAVVTRTTSAPAAAAAATTATTNSNASLTSASVQPTSTPSASSTAQKTGPARPSQPSPETPPPTSAPAMSTSKSKGGRPTHKKKGRNQYTKERDAREEQSATRSRSRDVPDNNQGKSGSGGGSGGSSSNTKSGSRSKGGANSRVSMTEMRRRVAAMSDFIGKTQIEIAGGEYLALAAATPDGGAQAGKGGSSANESSAATTPTSTAPQPAVNGATAGATSDKVGATEKDFKELPLLEMMDILTRDIIHWQTQYGG